MKYLTWSGGVIVMCLSWVTSLYTLWQVGNLPHSMCPTPASEVE